MSRPSLHNHVIAAFAFIFAAAFAATAPTTVYAQIGLDFLNLPPGAEIGKIFSQFYVFGVSMVVILALIMFTVGGVQYMITGGDRDPRPAKQRMKDALFGLILALISYLILFTINPDLVREVKLKTTIIDLINPADLSQEVQEGGPCGGTPKDPKHPESVTCAAPGKCYVNKTLCKESIGNQAGFCYASCVKKPINHNVQCNATDTCTNSDDKCRISISSSCQEVTGITVGKCLKADCK